MNNHKYFLFIGRWSPFHNGHKYIIDSFVNNGKPVCIAIRNSSEKYPVEIRKRMIEAVYGNNPLVKVIVIPDIEGVVVGRGVGYCLVDAPKGVKKISGTAIRQKELYNDVSQAVRAVIEEYENAKD